MDQALRQLLDAGYKAYIENNRLYYLRRERWPEEIRTHAEVEELVRRAAVLQRDA